VHLGHLHVAERVAERFGLVRVRLVPAARSPHKLLRVAAPAADRVAMVRLAVRDRPLLGLDTREVDRGGVSYTIDTLTELRDGADGIDPVFVLGADTLRDLGAWHRYAQLTSEFDFIAVDRPGTDLAAMRRALPPETAARVVDPEVAGVPADLGAGGRIVLARIEPLPIAARDVRERAAHGEPLHGLVPDAVGRYIRDHGLYGAPGAPERMES